MPASGQNTALAPVLPVVNSVSSEEKEFLAEVEVMDLSPLKGKSFCVAVATGDPKKTKYLCSTLHGPFDFTEMCQEVGEMWVQHQHHAKVIQLDKNMKNRVTCLNENTVDYIEAHYIDIIMEETLASFEDRDFTCTAGTVEEPPGEEAQRNLK